MLGFLRKTGRKDSKSAPSMTEDGKSLGSDYNEKDHSGMSISSSNPAAKDENWIDARDGYRVMASHLWKSCSKRNFFSENPDVASGVAIRFAKGQYVVCPAQDERLAHFCRSVAILNCEVAMTITSPVVSAINTRLAPGTTQIPITPSQHVQVVDTMEQLAGARKAQNACFIRRENTVVIWCDNVEQIEEQAQDLEQKMIMFIWRSSYSNNTSNIIASATSASIVDASMSQFNQNQAKFRSQSGTGNATPIYGAKAGSDADSFAASNPFSGTGSPDDLSRPSSFHDAEKSDPEKQGASVTEERPVNYQAPLMIGLTIGLDVVLCFFFISKLFQYSLLDGNWSRMGLAAAAPLMFPVIMFFCSSVISTVFQILGPVRQLHQNSRFYSGKAPKRIIGQLPHITIQMPVYKESLEGVLIPTIESVKKAISTYELQGGTASIIVSEDGMQLVSGAEQAIRHEFYEKNSIGWVARPGHGQEGYLRKGRFKKASNLNFTCRLSLAVEKAMTEHRPQTPQGLALWTEADEVSLYERCLTQCLPELHPLAQAKGNIRFGDFVLLIDSDTRVPEDCLLDAASEMVQSPEVGVLQHCSGVMLVSDSYFEAGMSFFTRLVNFLISFMVAAGDVAPFMGHNAFLRWSAIQEVAFVDPEDGISKIWSEAHVSEDFDMALRLIQNGYITRWATYSNNKFEEGVSLTCDDELNRWQKYAFGCAELVFNRIWEWPYRGPFTKLFRSFLWGRAPMHYKFSACSYIFSYYAIACGFPLCLGLYLAHGWFYPVLMPVYMPSFNIWVSVVLVFTCAGNVAQIIGRYRAKADTLFNLIKEHLVWIPFMFIFFGGLSFHILMALLAHHLGINMTWSATVKDLEDSNFFIEVPIIFKRFWKVLLLCFATLGGIVVLRLPNVLPLQWQIQEFFTYWPLLLTALLHVLYPIALNPALLRFSF
ncbi:glycosyltransferase family 2 protein [Moesziomyces antarcticus]|uniref:Glycosyltransferase family 2 protein n=2 Tax=Pseudozyma antarctica TaxID=84753 RepID=A0A081CH03_PSEA2|nr:glycosyltransferase family 2 protein [Moesziomyces antarcticus]GAK65949.1 glycosyltransferase family 2 protein [Moesziomyces antarcticus]